MKQLSAHIRRFSKAQIYDNFFTLLKNGKWALKLTWFTEKRLLLGLIGTNVVQSITPVGLALTARGIVNGVVSIMKESSENYTILFFWLSMGLALTISDALSRFAQTLFTQCLRDELNLKITTDMLIHADSLELTRFEDPRFQDIMARASQNTAVNFSDFIDNSLAGLRNLFQSISLIGLLVFIDPLIVLLMLPVAIPYLLYQWSLSKTRFHLEHSRATKRRWTGYFVGLLTRHESIPEVKVLGLGAWLTEKFKALMREFRDQDRKLYQRGFIINAIFAILSTTVAYVVFARVAFRVLEGALTIGDVAIFGGAAIRLRVSIESTIFNVTKALEQTLYISNLIEFFKIKPQVSPANGLEPSSSRGEIELKNVFFTYPGSSDPVLKDISLHIKPGETVALVGENGAGKTTLVKLIARLYDADEGSVLFDGHDVHSLSLEHLHNQLSFVFQGFGRYEGTVSDNIALGDYNELMNNHDRIEEIARLANIHEMIDRMPQKYDTMLGRTFGEYTLSGGQWQQIALARAFARESTLLILDEPTSNLDARTEYELFLHFKKLAEGRTTILISHRFSTVSMAERILVMDNGQVIEEGSHQELISQQGHYASLFRLHQLQMEPSHNKY